MIQEANKNLLLTNSIYIKQKEYWINRLSGDLQETRLLTGDGSNSAKASLIPGNPQEKVEIHINPQLFSTLVKLSKNTELSLYLILLASLKSLIYHYIGSEDIIVTSPLYKANISGDTLNNHLFIRQQEVGQLTFKELLLALRHSVFEAYQNQDYPFDDLIDFLYNSGRIQSRTFHPNIECLLQNIHDCQEQEDENIKDRLVFSFLWEESCIKGHISYNPGIYDRFYTEQLAKHFVGVMECVLENINIKIPDIVFLSRQEKEQLINDFNQTKTGYIKDKVIHEIFEEQVVRSPGRIAVSHENHQLSYSQLNKNANQLARLLGKKGVKPDYIVGIMVERSPEMIVGIMGILKAGGAYLPIEPGFPRQRLRHLAKDSDMEILVTHENPGESQGFAGHIIDLGKQEFKESGEMNPGKAVQPGNLAYVLYTSGSTGNPKGVMVEHRNVTNLVWGLQEKIYKNYNEYESLKVCLLAPYVFDASVKQVFAVLLLGHGLFIVPEDVRIDGERLIDFYINNKIHISDGTPTHLQLLMDRIEGKTSKLVIKHFLIGGEVLHRAIVEKFLNSFGEKSPKISNVYGPTECCVDSTIYEISKENLLFLGNIPIGKPMPNEQVYIIDRNNRPVPIGVRGELCIGGQGVGRGYLNSQELTAEKFCLRRPGGTLFDFLLKSKRKDIVHGFYRSHTSNKSYITYKTGDLARWLPDGNIEFLGRMDHQVKIRGYRVEPGEIESKLLTHQSIKEAVVVERRDQLGDMYLCAYIVTSHHFMVTQPELKDYLTERLPYYMIPSDFLQLETIPLTTNGKPDRKRLPIPAIERMGSYTPPENKIEEKLQTIWEEILGIKKEVIGIDSNFFQLRGNSLKATILAAKIHKALDVKLQLAQIFKTPTIRELAAVIKNKSKVRSDRYTSVKPVEKREYYSLSSAQKRLYILQQMEPGMTVYNMPQIMPLPEAPDIEKLEKTFIQLIERHDSLRTSFCVIDEEPVQKIHQCTEFKIYDYDISTNKVRVETGFEENEKIPCSNDSFIVRHFVIPFDLSQAPLLRVGVIKLPHTPAALRGHPPEGTYTSQERREDRYLLLVDMHHIISDGISLDILARDFTAIYGDKGTTLSPLRIQYRDFSQWQNSKKESGALHQQQTYWLNQFAGEIPVLDLPTDYSTDIPMNFEGASVDFELDRELVVKIKKIVAETNITLNIFLLAAFNILLSKHTGQEDIVVGSIIAGRSHADLQDIIGFFVNMLALRNQPTAAKTFKQFLADAKETAINAYENQDYPFEELVANLKIQRSPDRHPLVDTVFSFHHVDDAPGESESNPPNVSYRFDNKAAHFNLVLHATSFNDRVYMGFEYSIALFKKSLIEKFAQHYTDILKQAVANPGINMSDFKISHQRVMATVNILAEDQEEFNF